MKGDGEYACGKIVYLSQREARIVVKNLSKGDDGKKAYRCERCGYWHIGHKAAKHAKRRRIG